MRTRIQDARGVTFVELLVVLMVFSIVMGAVLSIFTSTLKAYWKGDLTTQVQQGGRVSFDRFTRDLRQSRRLITSTTAGGFTFSIQCSPNPQISFVLAHVTSFTLADGSTVYATDASSSGTVPYDGFYVSYYLAAAPAGSTGATTPTATGPYLNRTAYDLVAAALTTTTVGSNITSLNVLDRGTGVCATTAARELIVTMTASQTAQGQNVSSTDVARSDVMLRNQ